MSLENKIEALTAAVVALTAKLEAGNVAAPAPVAQAAEPAPVVAPAPVAAPVVAAPAPAPAMPAPPTFIVPAPAPAPTGAPFSDGKGLIEYVMAAYKALGPQKGAQIQTVLTSLAYTNISDVKPEHYAALYQGVEALKG
jgi:hypothetical protein